MRTLYVSDLDGTLLHSDETISEYSVRTINALVERGMLFSYATARSYSTASKITSGLITRVPLIVYNGAMMVEQQTGRILLSNFFGEDVRELLDDLMAHDIYPIVYAVENGQERFSYLPARCSRPLLDFTATRRGDKRDHPVASAEELLEGEVFYLTCIDRAEKLEPFFERYRDKYHVVYQRDIYTGEQWLEFMPRQASKANAARQLCAWLKCDRLVVFGDGKNDVDLFACADECYAVENAVDELRQMATAVIGSNHNDGVARWLLQNAEW